MNINTVTTTPLNVAWTGEPTLCRQPVTVAVPFKPAAVKALDGWWVSNAAGVPAASSVKVASRWPDGSVKWAHVKTVFTPTADEKAVWKLQGESVSASENSSSDIQPLQIEGSADCVTVRDGDLRYVFNTHSQNVFPDVYAGEIQTWAGDDFHIVTTGVKNDCLEFEKSSMSVIKHDAVSALVTVDGTVTVSSSTRLDISLQFEILSGRWLKLGVRIHNPHRARHLESLWDLGDEGSINFSEFAICIARNQDDSVKFQSESDLEWHAPATIKTTLFQASSGGENWDSPNHVDANGKVCCRFKGYRVEADGSQIQRGDRATPVVWVDTANGANWGMKIPQYWQNFPKCLKFETSLITLGLFPAEQGNYYELQGGERKLHDIVFSFSNKTDSLDWVDHPVLFTVPASTVIESEVLKHSKNDGGAAYNELLTKSLCSEAGFIAKREIIDEFGWRNFGDIYADHETLYHDSDDLFITHYNNQYDPIYGFARQYLLTGDERWHQLMIDLARHVLDIDIYRTEEDRAEYNHGLFWHTDHYKQAYTCTHRSYSHEHYINWQGDKGGGPGGEQCYTSGLVLYYQLTGDTEARDAVIGLAGWVGHFYEGTGTLLETLKNMISIDRRTFFALCKGSNVFRYKYGFHRGTGNLMRALLDSFEVTQDRSYIGKTEDIIMSTFASNDDLAARELDDPEHTWFYIVFLQEIIRYLDLKRELGELDSAFCYARDGLLYYAHWMAENEAPYLSQPERLEFPNDTWVAQDIRKANVFYSAYRYATDDRDLLLTKARFFRDYVLQTLKESSTLHFARMQILMLQNHGPSGLMDNNAEPYVGLDSLPVQEGALKSCFHTMPSFIWGVLGQLSYAVRKFSLRRELRWVKARMG